MQQQVIEQHKEKQCPQCDLDMLFSSMTHCHCQNCNQHFIEQILCPTCRAVTTCIQGCGAVNYLCPNDGLVSKRKIQYYYLPTELPTE